MRYLNVIAPLFIIGVLAIGCQELAYVTGERPADESREVSREAKVKGDSSDLGLGEGETPTQTPLLTAPQLITELLSDRQKYREMYVGKSVRIQGEIVHLSPGSSSSRRGTIVLGPEGGTEDSRVILRDVKNDYLRSLSGEQRLPPTHCVVLPDTGREDSGVITLGQCHDVDLPGVVTSPVVTPQQLVDELDVNPLQFGQQYGNEWVRVSGTIKQIHLPVNRKRYIVTLTIKGGGLDLHDLPQEEIVTLDKGKQVSAECVVALQASRKVKLVSCMKR